MTSRVSILTTLAAFALAPVSAFAQDDNTTVIDQFGDDNSALIEQSGLRNQAGSDADPLLQNAFFNRLVIRQTGEDNEVGLGSFSLLIAPGEDGDPDEVFNGGLEQIGLSATESVFNQITIIQESDRNIVGSVLQTARGVSPGAANVLNVTQGTNGAGSDNFIGTIIQIQDDGRPGQIARISQTGSNNTIELVDQRSQNSADGAQNIIEAFFSGSNNGREDLEGEAALLNLPSNSLVQQVGYADDIGNGNVIRLNIRGSNNRFGIYQGGTLNTVGTINIEFGAEQNQIGLRQDGFQNEIGVTTIQGNDNNIGLSQIGTNRAYVTPIAFSSGNRILGDQIGTNDLSFFVEGNDNALYIQQRYAPGVGADAPLGGDNEASISVTGSSNFFDLTQAGSNSATITVDQADNTNRGALSFFGLALVRLEAGVFFQEGLGNDITVTISGIAGGSGNMNMIAASQIGNNNGIDATMQGDMNQAVFAQTGDMNYAWLSQNGVGNTAAFIQ